MVYMGKCGRCGRVYSSPRKGEIIQCGCWKICPLCESPMEPYVAEAVSNTYGLGKKGLKIFMVCSNVNAHPDKAPFFSVAKPVEVVCV